jgi:hypothetical protein
LGVATSLDISGQIIYRKSLSKTPLATVNYYKISHGIVPLITSRIPLYEFFYSHPRIPVKEITPLGCQFAVIEMFKWYLGA